MAAKSVGSSKRRFWIMSLLGAAPDIDIFFGFLGSWAWPIQHRGLSHSLVGVVFQALFYAWIFGRWDKGPFARRAIEYSLPLFAHLGCDYLTAFGVPMLAPFTFREYSADLTVGLTLIPMFIMAVGLAWAYINELNGWKATRPIWAGWALYLFMTVSGKAYAAKLVPQEPRAMMIPSAASPFEWTVVCPDPKTHSYRRYEVDLMRGRREAASSVPMPGDELPVKSSLTSPVVQDFLKSNRWPVARVSATKLGGWDVEWGNLLFSTRGMVRGKVRVHVDDDGHVTSSERIYNFWNPSDAALKACS
ncbi:MAG: metal-dependent hydrolase [Elusimicrobia bacterium]|nr:metal-dependent hydrolase [Elusimicrobiota bacterium]